MNDLVIGIAIGYEFPALNNWIRSLLQCGFKGRKVLILGGVSAETIEKVASLGIETEVVDMPEDYIPALIVVDRFLILHSFLADQHDIRYVILTDVRDVVFQRNPSDFLDNLGTDPEFGLIVSSEGIKYKDEVWSNDNLLDSFPDVAFVMQEQTIYNAGVIAGKPGYLSDLALQVFLLSKHNPISNPDQTAMNILLSSRVWSEATRFSSHQDAWTLQAGTMMDPVKKARYQSKLIDGDMHINMDGRVENSSGSAFFILHQYDRVPELNGLVNSLYS
nr:hypothetical protein [uncultured Dyadobacter sp.]